KIERKGMVPTITTLLRMASSLERPVSYSIVIEETGREPIAFTIAGERASVFTPLKPPRHDVLSGPDWPSRSAVCVETCGCDAPAGGTASVSSHADTIHHVHTGAACFTDCRNHAVRLLDGCDRHSLCR